MNTFNNYNYYKLLLIISSLTPLKTKILLILSHISPKQLTATELTALLGYSKSSRIIYRGVLDELEKDQLIKLVKISKKKYSIQININHPMMNILNELSYEFGEDYSQRLLDILEDRE